MSEGPAPTPAPAEPVAPTPVEPVAPAPTPAPEPHILAEPPPAPVADPAPWASSASEDVRGFIQNKGWDSLDSMTKSYQGIEKLRGIPEERLLQLPDPNATEETRAVAMQELYGKLGRPEGPEGYQLPANDALADSRPDLDITADLRQWAFDQGLSSSQAEGLYGAYNQRMQEIVQGAQQKQEADIKADMQKLQNEWGAAYKENVAAAQRFLTRFDIPEPMWKDLEAVMGTYDAVKLFTKIGRSLGEHASPGDAAVDSGADLEFGMTPEAARDQIKQNNANKEFMEKYMLGAEKAPVEHARMRRLHQIGFPDEKV